MPLPDKIVSIGAATERVLTQYGNYPSGLIEAGCALRQEYLGNMNTLKRRRRNRVLVPLTMVKRESVKIMNFLYDAGLPETDIEVVVRCHPAAPFGTFANEMDFVLPENFTVSVKREAADELLESDVVLYTWTTVAVEALKLGIPIIYMDILRPMYVDPLFESNSHKRIVKCSDEIIPAIESIYNMNDEHYYEEQRKAQDYLDEYFYPVNDRNISPFFQSN